MDANGQPLPDLRMLLNSRVKNFLATENYNNDKSKDVSLNINKTSNKHPADVSSGIIQTKKIKGNTPILRYNPIFNTQVSQYIVNSQKITSAYHQLTGELFRQLVNTNIQQLCSNGCGYSCNNNNAKDENFQQVEQNINKIYETKTITHKDNNNINITIHKTSKPQTKNETDLKKMQRSNILLPNTIPPNQMQEIMDTALEAIYYITTNDIASLNTISKSDLELLNPLLRNAIRVRIISMSTGIHVHSKNSVINRYLKRYPKETNIKLLERCMIKLNENNSSSIVNSNILLANMKPTKAMQERMDQALEAILQITSKNMQPNISNLDLEVSSTLRKVIRDRITRVLTGHPVRSRSDIIDSYLEKYPNETDIELLDLFRMRQDKNQSLSKVTNHIFLPDLTPICDMREITDKALEAIVYLTSNNISTHHTVNSTDLELYSPILKNVIKNRITNIVNVCPVHSRSDIIEFYLKKYPRETNIEFLKLYKSGYGTIHIPNLIQTDNPKDFFEVNMTRLINMKMKKIIFVVERMFRKRKKRLLYLQKSNSKNAIQKRNSYSYVSLMVKGELSRLLAKFKNEIVQMILKRECYQAIQLKALR